MWQISWQSHDLLPAVQIGGRGEVGQDAGLLARGAQAAAVARGDGEVAGLVLGVIAAQTVQPPALRTVLQAARRAAAPQIGAVLRRGLQGRQGHGVRHKGQRAAAVQALHAVEKHQMTAVVAIEYPHGVELIPWRRRART